MISWYIQISQTSKKIIDCSEEKEKKNLAQATAGFLTNIQIGIWPKGNMRINITKREQ